jgi:hypothetical protein
VTETHQKLTFRCTDHEMKLIEDAASRAGKPKSHFVLDAVLSVINNDVPQPPASPQVLSEATQLQMAEGVFLLCALARRQHMSDGGDGPLFESAAERAAEILDGMQG